jgi:hypothetical protein
MRSLTLHLKILITILVLLGVSVTAYQIFVLGIPVTEDATDDCGTSTPRSSSSPAPRTR